MSNDTLLQNLRVYTQYNCLLHLKAVELNCMHIYAFFQYGKLKCSHFYTYGSLFGELIDATVWNSC